MVCSVPADTSPLSLAWTWGMPCVVPNHNSLSLSGLAMHSTDMGKTIPPSPPPRRRRLRLRLLKNPTKRPRPNNPLANYLRTDSHLYAPLAYASLCLTPSNSLPKPPSGKEPKLLEMIMEYLKSDSYMYSPLLNLPASSASAGDVCQVEACKTTMTAKEVIGNQLPESTLPESATHQPQPEVKPHGLLNKEVVKQSVLRASYRTSTPGGTAETMSRELRRLVG